MPRSCPQNTLLRAPVIVAPKSTLTH
ncbi:hypothetical protein CKAH01_08198 [Colletotrichum kahawae]|uniref:Uncharacterized protein n=1 Tax=Colletotrichum kahawae TaxID=34407 RepID=A0AAD9Y325_COLKA|nr:hypothetical protein CKAH01_08198 [Colletotrichum kahawae]